jgi:hypothetical protein
MVLLEAMTVFGGIGCLAGASGIGYMLYRNGVGAKCGIDGIILKKEIKDNEEGIIHSTTETKDQLLFDLEKFVKFSENKVVLFPYTPVFNEWTSYDGGIYANDEFLKIINAAVNKKNRKFNFIVNTTNLDSMRNGSNRTKDLVTLANESSINLILKNEDDIFNLYIGGNIGGNKGKKRRIFRIYTADRNNSIIYAENSMYSSIKFTRSLPGFGFWEGNYSNWFDKTKPNKYRLDYSTFNVQSN